MQSFGKVALSSYLFIWFLRNSFKTYLHFLTAFSNDCIIILVYQRTVGKKRYIMSFKALKQLYSTWMDQRLSARDNNVG